MNSIQHTIQTTKTARVYTYGTFSDSTELVWIVAHGYGFLAEYFIKKFECLNPDKNFVIVPEALNRFYTQGMSGRVGASWMTTEDRENEIADYISYLDNVYVTFNLHRAKKIVALGFSQGASTICRWIIKSKYKVNTMVLWGGSVPNDCLIHQNAINALHPYLLVGDTDEFITEQVRIEEITRLDNAGLTFSHIFYKGGHAIVTEPLIQLSEQLTKA